SGSAGDAERVAGLLHPGVLGNDRRVGLPVRAARWEKTPASRRSVEKFESLASFPPSNPDLAPGREGRRVDFSVLPKDASAKLPSRGMTAIEGSEWLPIHGGARAGR